MSPTVFRWKAYRFFFFSREEARVHVHVTCPDGEAKIWIEPDIEVAHSHGLSEAQVRETVRFVTERRDEIVTEWRRHFH